MKNLKNFAFGLLVAVLALGFSAFTKAEKSNQIVQISDWYEPLDDQLDPNSMDALDFSNYHSTPLDTAPNEVTDCPGDEFVCAARFPDTGQPAVQIYDKD